MEPSASPSMRKRQIGWRSVWISSLPCWQILILAGWDGLGLAVQAYQKRALPLINWVAALGRRTHHRIPVLRPGEGCLLGQRDQPAADWGCELAACARRMLSVARRLLPSQRTQSGVCVESAKGASTQRLHGI